MKRVSLRCDPGALPPLPWEVWPERTGARANILDANGDHVATLTATNRTNLMLMARLLEELTRAMLETQTPDCKAGIGAVEPARGPAPESWWRRWRRRACRRSAH